MAFQWETDLLAQKSDNGVRNYAIDGILWAVNSGRIGGEIAMHLRTLTASDLGTLVDNVIAASITMDRVPRFLNTWFYGAAI